MSESIRVKSKRFDWLKFAVAKTNLDKSELLDEALINELIIDAVLIGIDCVPNV